MKITEFEINLQKEKVLRLIECYPESPVYENVSKEYEEMVSQAYERLNPIAILEYGNLPEEGDCLFCIETVGQDISDFVTELFEEGHYVRGMLVDAIADEYLFQVDGIVQNIAMKVCKEKNFGIKERLEAMHNAPLEIQETAWKVTHAGEEMGLHLKESGMFEPLKTNCQVYVLQEGCATYETEHRCEGCIKFETCKARNDRKYLATVVQGEKEIEIEGTCGQTVMELLQEAEIYLDAVCGGRGTCGKCKVRFLEGAPSPTEEEQRRLTISELEKGYRLACKAIPKGQCRVLVEAEEKFSVLSEYSVRKTPSEETITDETVSGIMKEEPSYGLVADIGTTTIVMQLIECENGSVVDTFTTLNHQRAYGADVISRIHASNTGKQENLQQLIREDLQRGISELLKGKKARIGHMVISGNTTMIHLLMGYSCETLGVYPFTPVNLDRIESDSERLFGETKYEFPITILPGISTYVGGDIVAGLLACGFHANEKISMLIDLGTNGEMAIGNKDKILVASTAVGPAFEWGNITCGTGSIQGAISHISSENGDFRIETIGGKEPIGICGTGVIDIMAEILERGWMDKTGLLDEVYEEEGICITEKEKSIRFYQKDVREIQLAKAAVRAGIETLIHEYGIDSEEIDTIYIAGGFGYTLNVQNACRMGLFPKLCEEKLRAIGNSSLQGAIQYLLERDAKENIENIRKCSKEISLALCEKFQDSYIENMYF